MYGFHTEIKIDYQKVSSIMNYWCFYCKSIAVDRLPLYHREPHCGDLIVLCLHVFYLTHTNDVRNMVEAR